MIATRITAGIAAAVLAAGLAGAAPADAASRSARAPQRCFDTERLVRGFIGLRDRNAATVEALILGQLEDKSKRAEVKGLFDSAKRATGGDPEKMVRVLFPQMSALCPELKPLAGLVATAR